MKYKYSRKECNQEIEILKRIFTGSQIMPGGWLETVEQYLHATQLMLLATVDKPKRFRPEELEDNILVKHLSTDRGGATTKVSREGATLKHTAKVRPLQEFIQTETTYGITTVKVLNDFWNWSKEVTNSINEIIDHLNSMEEGK